MTLALILISSCPAISYSTGSAQLSNASEPAVSPAGGALLKKILSASSLSNIQIISFVDGIEVSGLNLGDSDITVTLKQTAPQTNKSNISTPVTVTAVRVPGSSIKDPLTLMENIHKLKGGRYYRPGCGDAGSSRRITRGFKSKRIKCSPQFSYGSLGCSTQIGVGDSWRRLQIAANCHYRSLYRWSNSSGWKVIPLLTHVTLYNGICGSLC